VNDVNLLSEVRALLAGGKAKEAAATLVQAAQRGQSEAMYEFALWAIAGNVIPRNLALAYDWLGRATQAGSADGALLRAYFTAAGTGCLPDWQSALELLTRLGETSEVAARQVEKLGQMKMTTNGEPLVSYNLDLCSSQPRVAICRQFLTDAECDYVADIGAPFLEPSYVVDPNTQQLIPHPVRRSHGAMFGVYTEDLVINAINRRIASLSGTAYENGEPLQLLQYRRGDEYRPHLDALPNEPNQRVMTLIIYLTDGYDGGETQFSRTGLSFKGQKGDALLFANLLPDGRPDPLSLHCGLPVFKGTKTIATRWIRRSRFTYPAPPSILKLPPGLEA
jgi:prolyl 4-hydroxylase